MNSENVKPTVKKKRYCSKVSFFGYKDVDVRKIWSGVYAIECLVTRKYYIGSSVHILQRLYQHWGELIRGTHHSEKLQRAFNKYGKDEFKAYYAEYVDISEGTIRLREREQVLIEAYDAVSNGYNVEANATAHHKRRPKVKQEDITGQKFNRLTVLGLQKAAHGFGTKWHCICDCGNESYVKYGDLTKNRVRSCGCLQIETVRKKMTTHGMSDGHGKKNPAYSAWAKMKSACDTPTDANYGEVGAKGVSYKPAWVKFEAFYADMGDKPEGEYVFGRLDKSKDYTPENCKWLHRSEVMRISANAIYLEYKGERKSLQEWAKITGIKPKTIQCRIDRYGWTVEKALETKTYGTRPEQVKIEFNGETLTINEWAKRTGIIVQTLKSRYLEFNWSAEKTLTTPPAKQNKKVK